MASVPMRRRLLRAIGLLVPDHAAADDAAGADHLWYAHSIHPVCQRIDRRLRLSVSDGATVHVVAGSLLQRSVPLVFVSLPGGEPVRAALPGHELELGRRAMLHRPLRTAVHRVPRREHRLPVERVVSMQQRPVCRRLLLLSVGNSAAGTAVQRMPDVEPVQVPRRIVPVKLLQLSGSQRMPGFEAIPLRRRYLPLE